jgi:hypothetical protein
MARDNHRDIRSEIESLLKELSESPWDLALHQRLRASSLRYKVAGGPSAGTRARLWPLPKDSAQRLLRIAQLWSLDPGNPQYPFQMLDSAAALESSDKQYAPLVAWLRSIVAVLAQAL